MVTRVLLHCLTHLSACATVKPHVHKRQITILLRASVAFLAILHHSLLIASFFFTSASPFLVPVLYMFPSLEKDVVLNIDE